jgi:hypothetical protein
MAIQWQMVGKQIDVGLDQRAQSCRFHASNTRWLRAPEIAMMDQNGVSSSVARCIDQRLTGCHAGHQMAHIGFSFNLQPIWAIVFEALRRQ